MLRVSYQLGNCEEVSEQQAKTCINIRLSKFTGLPKQKILRLQVKYLYYCEIAGEEAGSSVPSSLQQSLGGEGGQGFAEQRDLGGSFAQPRRAQTVLALALGLPELPADVIGQQRV